MRELIGWAGAGGGTEALEIKSELSSPHEVFSFMSLASEMGVPDLSPISVLDGELADVDDEELGVSPVIPCALSISLTPCADDPIRSPLNECTAFVKHFGHDDTLVVWCSIRRGKRAPGKSTYSFSGT
jgi:hypothetical protein